jgi:nucleoside-diphosphate-sugar epimerase
MQPLQPGRRHDEPDEVPAGAGVVVLGQAYRRRRTRVEPDAGADPPSVGDLGLRLLILGGTWFVGRTLAELALARGFRVTCFNRGRDGQDVAGVRSIRGDRTDPADVARLAGHGPWDAVIDTSVYEPPDARLTSAALRPVTGRYVLVSTVSVYREWPDEPADESSPVWPCRLDARGSDPDIAALPEGSAYGALKSGCERVVREVYDADALILRPGVILGPYENVGRLPALLGRAVRGGRMLAAGDPDRPIQPVDVRDLAEFTLDRVEAGSGELFNVVSPIGHATHGDLLGACVEATGSAAELVWADAGWLADQQVGEWREMPLWSTAPGTWAVDATRARAAGLTCRPLRHTVIDTWRWLADAPLVPHDRRAEHGLDPGKEARLLAAWDAERVPRR